MADVPVRHDKRHCPELVTTLKYSESVKRFCPEIIISNKTVIGVRGHKWGIHKLLLPRGVLRIGHGAFSYCVNATTVHLPDTLTHVYDSAFEGCRMITSLTLPDTLTH